MSESTHPMGPDNRGVHLTIGVQWVPPLTVLHDLSIEEVKALEDELDRLVATALAELWVQYSLSVSDTRYSVSREFAGPYAQAVELVKVVFENLPAELAVDLMSEALKFATLRAAEEAFRAAKPMMKTALGKLQFLKRRAGHQEIAPRLTIESHSGAAFGSPWDTDVTSTYDLDLAPTDLQLESSPLVFYTTDVDIRSVSQDIWSEFADYSATPVPNKFRELIQQSFSEVTNVEVPRDLFDVVVVDRPPRADALFPSHFVDLAPIYEYLRDTVPNELLSVLVAEALRVTYGKMRSWFVSKKLPANAVRASFSGMTLEALAENYVRKKRHPRAKLRVSREPFNTKYEGGYYYPINPDLPMGWRIIVKSYNSLFDFVVDSDANIISLEVRALGEVISIANANLRDPEADSVPIARLADSA